MEQFTEVPKEVYQALIKPLPKEAIKPHPTKNYLSTIKVIYEHERLNEVFGLNGWRDSYEIVEKEGKMVVVKGRLEIPKYGIVREAFGGNDNQDLGDAYKGACTDALSKMCSSIGIGMDVYKGLGDEPSKKAAAAENQAKSVSKNGTISGILLTVELLDRKAPKRGNYLKITHTKQTGGKNDIFICSDTHKHLYEAITDAKTNSRNIELAFHLESGFLMVDDVLSVEGIPYKNGKIAE